MGDALDLLAEDLRLAVRQYVGVPGQTLPFICDEITDEVCRFWPSMWATDLARRAAEQSSGQQLVDGLAVVRAKCRETLEARLGAGKNERAAIDLLLPAIVAAIAWFWFDSYDTRAKVRRAVWHVRHG